MISLSVSENYLSARVYVLHKQMIYELRINNLNAYNIISCSLFSSGLRIQPVDLQKLKLKLRYYTVISHGARAF